MTATASDPDKGSLSIGELSRYTGVEVRTIRLYCDEGVLEPRRSNGDRPRFDVSAVDRVTLSRTLHAHGFSPAVTTEILAAGRSISEAVALAAITEVLADGRTIDEAIAAMHVALTGHVAARNWRHAALEAVANAPAAERATRLSLLSAAADGSAAHQAITAFWNELAPASANAQVLRTFLDRCVPEPPAEPTPEQVVGYARLLALTKDQALKHTLRARGRVDELLRDNGALLFSLRKAVALATPHLAAEAPDPTEALAVFVHAYANAHGRRDTANYRRELLMHLAPDRDPRLRRYWQLVADIRGLPQSDALPHSRLLDALERSVTAGSPPTRREHTTSGPLDLEPAATEIRHEASTPPEIGCERT